METQRSDRLNRLPPYLFADLRRRTAEARARGVEVISLGIGDPDMPAPDQVVEELCRAATDASDPDRHRYGCDRPVEALAESVRDFYRRRFAVSLAGDQVAATMGSKDAIVKLSLGVLNPGDVGIAPSPGYPTYNIGHVLAGATTYHAPLLADRAWEIDFDAIPDETVRQAKLLWLNYPNNPTTAIASMGTFERAVAFARRHGLLLAHDAAYSVNTYDGYVAPSVLQVSGADEVAVELFSLSKAFCMTGWRVGFAVGNASAVATLKLVKDNVDNGSPRPVQFAAARALDLAERIIPPINDVYRRRRDLVVDALNQAGWSLARSAGTIYVWAPVPASYGGSSAAFAADLLERAGVVVTPGLGYGQAGEGYFRISLTYADDVLAEAVRRIVDMLR
jgi:LL-diaminopimelate aminotransferase